MPTTLTRVAVCQRARGWHRHKPRQNGGRSSDFGSTGESLSKERLSGPESGEVKEQTQLGMEGAKSLPEQEALNLASR